MSLLIRIRKKLERKLLHKPGQHGTPVYYAPADDEVEEISTATTTPPTATPPSSRPSSRLPSLSFLSSSRRHSSQQRRQSSTRSPTTTAPTDNHPSPHAPPRSPSFFCRGSSSHHARNGSNLSSITGPGGGGGRRSETWTSATTTTDHDNEECFRFPVFPDSGYVSRESNPDVGFVVPDSPHQSLANPSQLGNAMTIGGGNGNGNGNGNGEDKSKKRPRRESPPFSRGVSSATTTTTTTTAITKGREGSRASSHGNELPSSAYSATTAALSPSLISDRYEAPSAMSPNEDFISGRDSTATAAEGLRGFEGVRGGKVRGGGGGNPRFDDDGGHVDDVDVVDYGFFPAPPPPAAAPAAPARPPVAAARPGLSARSQTAAAPPVVANGSRTARTRNDDVRDRRPRLDDARRDRRPFTTTTALTGYGYTTGQL